MKEVKIGDSKASITLTKQDDSHDIKVMFTQNEKALNGTFREDDLKIALRFITEDLNNEQYSKNNY